jgi:putative heme-binding domain-containing protein
VLVLLLLPATVAGAHSQSQNSKTQPAGASTGQRAFAARCASCHGLDGRGAERGPNIATSPKTQRLSDTELTRVISNGRPNAGMPAFRLAGKPEIQTLVAYVRTLQGNRRSALLAGNSVRGKVIFFGKADCGSCHMVAGEGGFLGSDLSSYAQSQNPNAIRNAITNPISASARARVALATTSSGQTFKGLVRNEDNFSLQLQSEDGSFQLFLKSELQKLEYQPQPFMPTDYGERLSRQELDDLVGYLQSVASTKTTPGHETD